MPLSSYIDLGDPEAVAIEEITPHGFTVVIKGKGDEGYIARIAVEGEAVVQRRLFSPGFEGDSGETAKYKYPPDW